MLICLLLLFHQFSGLRSHKPSSCRPSQPRREILTDEEEEEYEEVDEEEEDGFELKTNTNPAGVELLGVDDEEDDADEKFNTGGDEELELVTDEDEDEGLELNTNTKPSGVELLGLDELA